MMSVDELQWLIGVSVTVLLAIATMLIAAFRALSGKIEKGNSELAKGIKDGDDHLHERVNRVRDEYVKRVDLDGHMTRMETNVKELRDENREGTREINRRLDTVLSTLQPSPPIRPRRS